MFVKFDDVIGMFTLDHEFLVAFHDNCLLGDDERRRFLCCQNFHSVANPDEA